MEAGQLLPHMDTGESEAWLRAPLVLFLEVLWLSKSQNPTKGMASGLPSLPAFGGARRQAGPGAGEGSAKTRDKRPWRLLPRQLLMAAGVGRNGN